MKLFDVLAVDHKTKTVRVLAVDKDQRNAEAIINMAFARRGVEEEFYVEKPAGQYKDGDILAD